MEQKQLRNLSRTLTLLLRHRGREEGLEIKSNGFAKLDDLFLNNRVKKFDPTLEDIKKIVQNDEKGRFTLVENNGSYFLKANQGHSIEVDQLNLKKITDENEIKFGIHGTNYKAWNIISKEGLKIMGRTHIHFAIDENEKAGIRKNSDIHIYLDIQKCLKDGIELFLSENNVLLSKGQNGIILPKYFLKIVDKNEKKN